MKNVLRLRSSSRVSIFNKLGEWDGSIVELSKNGATVDLIEKTREPPPVKPPCVHLVCACLKKNPMKTLLEKTTEVNVSKITFVKTANTDGANVRLAGKWLDGGKASDVVKEGSEQCGRLDVPDVTNKIGDLKAVIDDAQQGDVRIAVCRERSPASVPIVEFAGGLPPDSSLMLLVGPEGGWSPLEEEWFDSESKIVPVSLGSNVLRAETAAILAVGVLGNLRT